MPHEERRAVFLDRDGVLNEALLADGKPYAPLTLGDFHIVDQAAESVARLKAKGFVTVVVTNQPELGSGQLKPETLEQMHGLLFSEVGVDDIEICGCGEACRRYKPEPGQILDACHKWDIAPASSFMIGDRWRDMDAGRNAGCRTILIGPGYKHDRPATADFSAPTLSHAVDIILANQ